jgi:hypothetical protein
MSNLTNLTNGNIKILVLKYDYDFMMSEYDRKGRKDNFYQAIQ